MILAWGARGARSIIRWPAVVRRSSARRASSGDARRLTMAALDEPRHDGRDRALIGERLGGDAGER